MKRNLFFTTLLAMSFVLSACLAGQQSDNQNQNTNTNTNTNKNVNQNINTNSNQNINTNKNTNTMPEETITQATFKTSMGDITVKFFADESPQTVANFVKLAKEGFYDNTKFHRVIKDFMIQGGDPLSKDNSSAAMWGTGGPGYAFADEFNQHKIVKGSLAMANSGPNTNGSQFFIVTAEATPWLDGAHTNFGQVTAGMDVVDAIGVTPTGARDVPVTPVVINSIELK